MTDYNEVAFGDVGLWDVEQMEVFRGAQSTLQGRNAVAGTLVVKTKDPSYRPEVKLRAGAGTLGMSQVSAMVSGPLVDDRVAARLVFDRSAGDSFVQGFGSFPGVEQPGAFESLTLRGKLLIEPDAAKRFSTLLTFNHSTVTSPQTEGVLRPFAEHISRPIGSSHRRLAAPASPTTSPSSATPLRRSSSGRPRPMRVRTSWTTA